MNRLKTLAAWLKCLIHGRCGHQSCVDGDRCRYPAGHEGSDVMWKCRLLAVTLLAVLVLAPTVSAQTIAIGTVRFDQQGYAYAYNGTYWTYGTQLYLCTGYVPATTYVSCGRYCSTAGYYTFSLYTPPVVAAAVIPPYSPNWKTEVTKAIDQQNDRLAYLEAVKPLYPAKVFGAVGYNYTNSLLAGNFGFNTSTIYGYQLPSVAAVIDPYAKFDLNQFGLAYSQAVKGQIEAGDKAQQGFAAVFDGARSSKAELDRLRTITEAFKDAVKLSVPPTTSNSSLTFSTSPAGPASPQQPAVTVPKSTGATPTKDLEQRLATSAQSCVQCHYGNRKDGNFDLAQFFTYPADIRLEAVRRISLPETDPDHMPKGGKSLSDTDKAVWGEAASFRGTAPMSKIK